MSLSLSSLLNPSPDADQQQQQSSSPTSSSQRKNSLPPIQYLQSPEQTYASSALPGTRQGYTYPPATEQDAARTLAALSGSPIATNTTSSGWHGQGQQNGYEARRSSYDRRPGSSGMQLPMPTPSADARKMSSPTLEHYHVSSRSPEQSKAGHGMTLPPLQRMSSRDESARAPAPEQPPSPRQASHEGEVGLTSHSFEDPHFNSVTTNPTQPHIIAHSPSQLEKSQSTILAAEPASSPAAVKEESMATPPISSPTEARRMSTQQDADGFGLKAVASLKSEHSANIQSPLREASVPVPSTETAMPEPANPKKRPAPTKKKGTATAATKKAPPAKKRKVESKRSATPSSIASKTPASKLASGKATPANSSPAPSSRSHSDEPNEEAYDEDEEMEDGDIDDDDVYCLCRKRDTGTFMIGCDGTCDDWFHGKCVGIEERDKNLIDKYMCPNCQKAGIGRTSWKRICRRHGCRQPARIGKTKGGKDGSKYCSEECGVMYFREMVAKTRGKEDAVKNRSSRRKGSLVSTGRPVLDDDLGARGGIIAAGELKALVTSTKSAEDFKKLGEGVLSPPTTPDSKKGFAESVLTEAETNALQTISRQKDAAREKHQLLKDRMKFVTMAKQAASRTATEKELKPKDYCGYDSRLEWTDAQFHTWRISAPGKQAFELETLATDVQQEDNGDEDEGWEVCERKKCARHLEWTKLAIDDVRSYMSDNGDAMRELDREERGVRERAALRAKAGSVDGGGEVEVHGLGIAEEGSVSTATAMEGITANDGMNAEAKEEPVSGEAMVEG